MKILDVKCLDVKLLDAEYLDVKCLDVKVKYLDYLTQQLKKEGRGSRDREVLCCSDILPPLEKIEIQNPRLASENPSLPYGVTFFIMAFG